MGFFDTGIQSYPADMSGGALGAGTTNTVPYDPALNTGTGPLGGPNNGITFKSPFGAGNQPGVSVNMQTGDVTYSGTPTGRTSQPSPYSLETINGGQLPGAITTGGNGLPINTGGSGGSGGGGVDLGGLSGFANSASVSPFTGLNYNDFMNGPGYQFARDQGLQALNRSLASSGVLNTGGAAKKGAEFVTGLANQFYGDAFNRALQTHQQQFGDLFNLATLGANTTASSFA